MLYQFIGEKLHQPGVETAASIRDLAVAATDSLLGGDGDKCDLLCDRSVIISPYSSTGLLGAYVVYRCREPLGCGADLLCSCVHCQGFVVCQLHVG